MEIIPSAPTRYSTLSVKAQGFSPGGAGIEWIVNGKAVSSPYAYTYPARDLSRGDEVRAKTTVDGKEVFSSAVTIGNTPPEIVKARIIPESPGTAERLRVEAEAKDPDGDGVTLAYEWTKNGEPAGNGEVLETDLKRGDKVTVKVTPSDAWSQGNPVTIPVTLSNIPPVIDKNGRFNFDGRVCTYQVKATDPDGDPLTYSLKNAPSGMTVDPETGAIRWEVPQDFGGKVSFTAVVKDGRGGESEQNLNFTINKQ